MLQISLLAASVIWSLPPVDVTQADSHSSSLTDLRGKSVSSFAVKTLRGQSGERGVVSDDDTTVASGQVPEGRRAPPVDTSA